MIWWDENDTFSLIVVKEKNIFQFSKFVIVTSETLWADGFLHYRHNSRHIVCALAGFLKVVANKVRTVKDHRPLRKTPID